MPKTKSTALLIRTPIGNRIHQTPRPEDLAPTKDLQNIGGILIPESGAAGKVGIEPYYVAIALAVGPDCKTIKKGDRFLSVRGMDWEVHIDGKLVGTFIRENEIVATLK